MCKCGILLPLTSRCTLKDEDKSCRLEKIVKPRLRAFIENVLSFVCLNLCTIYVGIDKEDWFNTVQGKEFLNGEFQRASIPYKLKVFDLEPGKICAIWKALANDAFNDNQDVTVLLGDDVRIYTSDWLERITRHYRSIADRLFTTKYLREKLFGFGLIAICDQSCPNFPSFPVVHRLHWLMNDREIFSNDFVNQDADPFLFYTYSKWNASLIAHDVILRNEVGGFGPARYIKEHCNWKGEILSTARSKIGCYLEKNRALKSMNPCMPSIDIVVPTYRAMDNMEHLKEICQISLPNQSSNFIIIVDRPNHLDGVRSELEKLPNVRVRGNTANIGAPASRNVGLLESAADWILFLDDDVFPDKNILQEYSAAILKHEDDALGFIGSTKFPPSLNLHTRAIQLSDLTYMFGIADVLNKPKWGVTANLVVRRMHHQVMFNAGCWAKTGGGEDIDLCLQYHEVYNIGDGDSGKMSFFSAPEAVAVHPWWNNSTRQYAHFFKWAVGDGHLFDHYPIFTYYSCPNISEAMLLVVILSVMIIPCFGPTFALKHMILSMLGILEAEIFVNLNVHLFTFSKKKTSYKGPVKYLFLNSYIATILASAESAVLIFVLESGRIWGHAVRGFLRGRFMPLGSQSGICCPKRRGLLANTFIKFDWMCGEVKDAVQFEKKRALVKFIMYLIIGVGLQMVYITSIRAQVYVIYILATAIHIFTAAFLGWLCISHQIYSIPIRK